MIRVTYNLPSRAAPPIRDIAKIQSLVADHYGVSVMDLKSERRMRSIAWPRQTAMWLARRLTEHSLPAIGNRFGGRDHSTVLHAVHQVDGRRERDKSFAAELAGLEAAAAKSLSRWNGDAAEAVEALAETEGAIDTRIDGLFATLRAAALTDPGRTIAGLERLARELSENGRESDGDDGRN